MDASDFTLNSVHRAIFHSVSCSIEKFMRKIRLREKKTQRKRENRWEIIWFFNGDNLKHALVSVANHMAASVYAWLVSRLQSIHFHLFTASSANNNKTSSGSSLSTSSVSVYLLKLEIMNENNILRAATTTTSTTTATATMTTVFYLNWQKNYTKTKICILCITDFFSSQKQ